MENTPRTSSPTDVTDEEWAFVAPYLTLMRPDAPPRVYDPREVCNALRWIVRTGAPWRMLPTNFPPWEAVDQQTQRWLAVGCCAAMVHDLRALLRWSAGSSRRPGGGGRHPGHPPGGGQAAGGQTRLRAAAAALGGGALLRLGGALPPAGAR